MVPTNFWFMKRYDPQSMEIWKCLRFQPILRCRKFEIFADSGIRRFKLFECMELKIFTISVLSRLLFVLCLQGKPSETRNLFDCRRIRMLSRNLSARIPELGGACWLARSSAAAALSRWRWHPVQGVQARTWHFPHHQAATWVKDGSAGELQESLESRIFIQTSRMVSDSLPEPRFLFFLHGKGSLWKIDPSMPTSFRSYMKYKF